MADGTTSVSGMIDVEVCFARPDMQRLIVVRVGAGTKVRDVLAQSGLVEMFPEIDPLSCPLGVFGRRVDDEFEPADGDRIEIYRELRIDPREARRARARRRAG